MTILALSVVLPVIAGVTRVSLTPAPIRLLTLLCAVWLTSDVVNHILREQNLHNAQVSYILTGAEIFIVSHLYRSLLSNRMLHKQLPIVAWLGLPLGIIEWYLVGGEINTVSLVIEFVLFMTLAMVLFYESTMRPVSPLYRTLNYVLVFYFASSLPYNFAWEWLKDLDFSLLLAMNYAHGIIHAACYILFTWMIWRSSLSYSV